MELECIFVTSGRHPETEKLICKATGGMYSHAACRIMIEGKPRIIEATMDRGVHISDGSIFDDCETIQIIPFQITEAQRLAIIDKAFELVGKPYGRDDCIIGGTMDVLGEGPASIAEHIFGDDGTENCSSTLAQLIRVLFHDFAINIHSSKLTPEAVRSRVEILHREALCH